jgi:hypothetical protein
MGCAMDFFPSFFMRGRGCRKREGGEGMAGRKWLLGLVFVVSLAQQKKNNKNIVVPITMIYMQNEKVN